MSIWKEPTRLSEQGAETSAFLRDALVKARRKTDTDAQVRRIAERLSPMIKSKGPLSIATNLSIGPASSGFSLTGKILSVMLSLGILSAVLYMSTRESRDQTPARTRAPSVSVRETSSPLLPETDKADQDQKIPKTEPLQSAPALKTRLKARHRSQIDSDSVEADAPRAFYPAEELTLLKGAQQALDRQPQQTLDLTEQHLRLFPEGVFGQEREMLAIEALSKMGKKELARQRGERFLEHFPNSAHIRRIDNLLERRK